MSSYNSSCASASYLHCNLLSGHRLPGFSVIRRAVGGLGVHRSHPARHSTRCPAAEPTYVPAADSSPSGSSCQNESGSEFGPVQQPDDGAEPQGFQLKLAKWVSQGFYGLDAFIPFFFTFSHPKSSPQIGFRCCLHPHS